MDEPRKWGHDELQEDLAAYLRGNTERMCWTNMQLGPVGSKRPDVYTLEKRYAAWNPTAYECKVSLSDFRTDVTAGKWQAYLQFATAVVFAAPAGLLTKDDVPAACGLILRDGRTWRHARKPIHNPCANLPRETWMKMLIDGVQRTQAEQRREWGNLYQAEQALKKQVGDVVAAYMRDMMVATDMLAKITEQVEEMKRTRTKTMASMERAEIAAYAGVRERLAAVLGMPSNTALEFMTTNLEDQVASRLASLKGNAEVKRLQHIIDNITSTFSHAMKQAAIDPKEQHVPYWWAKQHPEISA